MSTPASRAVPGQSYVPGIDGLRAIAVSSVVLFHLDPAWLPGGFTGVDVFFVISGYVIARSLAGTASASLSAFLLGFYKRRMLRLLPALAFCVILTSLVSSLFVAESWLSRPNEWTALWSFFGVSNFFLAGGADGYFYDRIPFNPFVHTWTLGVEEQFYLFFPLVLYVWLNPSSREGRGPARLLVTLPCLALASFAWSSYDTGANPPRAFYLLPSRFWELAAGALLFQRQVRPTFAPGLRIDPAAMLHAGILVMVVGFCLADERSFPFPWAIVPVVGTVLAIAGITERERESRGIHALLESRAVTYVGRISYSLYLWHWPVFSLFRWTVGLDEAATRAAASLLAVALAVFSYHALENRIRRNRFLRGQPGGRIVAAGAALALLGFLATAGLFAADARLGLNLSVASDGCTWRARHSPDCEPEAGISGPDEPSGQSLFVIGDSHVDGYHTMAVLAAARLGAEVWFRTQPGCPIASLIHASDDGPGCRDYEVETLDWLRRRAKPGDVVFLASLRVRRLGAQWGALDGYQGLSPERARYESELRATALVQAARFVEALQALGLHVLIDAPKPLFRAPPFRCQDWFNAGNPACDAGFEIDREFLLRYREPTMASIRALQESHGVKLWDPFPVLCDGPVCSAFDGDRPLYMDGDHLSGHGNRVLVPSFSERLRQIWSDGAQPRPSAARRGRPRRARASAAPGKDASRARARS